MIHNPISGNQTHKLFMTEIDLSIDKTVMWYYNYYVVIELPHDGQERNNKKI